MLPLALLTSSALCLVPTGMLSDMSNRGAHDVSRRALVGFAAAAIIGGPHGSSPASAAQLNNEAEAKLAAILDREVKERKAALGFTIDADDIRELENVLRNKYCGPSGSFIGEPGGTCAESLKVEGTCFKATGFATSCTKSYGSG